MSTIQAPQDNRTELARLVTLAAEDAARADHDGVLSGRVVDAIVAAGIPGHFVPAQLGGGQGSFGELSRAMTLLGESCASASWVATMFAYSARFATFLPARTQSEIWGDNPQTVWASGLVPTGSSTPVADGVRLSGRWGYVSGAEFADFVILAGPQPGPGAPVPHFHAIPRGSFTIERTWNTMGMRATGSHTVILDDVLVPNHRMAPVPQVFAGRNPHSTIAQHNVPLPSVGGLTCIVPALGAARAALKTTETVMATRRPAMESGARALFDDAFAQASVELDSIELLIERIIDVLDSGTAGRNAIRNARDASYAAQLLRSLTERLATVGGTSGQDRHGSLNRCWRDVFTGTSHAALRFEKAAGAFTEQRLAG